MRRRVLTLLLAGCAAGALAQTSPGTPRVIAMVAAVGDQVTFVRQKLSVGSNIEPFSRRSFALNGQSLNFAVLRGLAQGIAEEEPDAQRVLLSWEAPPDTLRLMAEARGNERNDVVLQALIEHLSALPERAQWDRIEALLPRYFREEIRGMGSKLGGVGIYVQALKSAQLDLSEEGWGIAETGPDGHHRTIDPKTGKHGRATTYVAPYIYFERITLDAATLKIVSRKSQFDNIKYNDPTADAEAVAQHLPLTDLMGRLLELAERSAYQSVRGKNSSVDVTAPRELPAGRPAAASAPGG
jgi:hypothetical protein